MALTTKRIIALPAQTDPQEGDYLAIDNATSGTHKIPAGRIGVEVDDTLTEAGKAADAKAVGDALDEIRSQIEVTGTASGAIATFADGSDAPMKSCMVSIVPKQSGSGTPSPDNVRQISGWESVSVNVTGKNLFRPKYSGRTHNGVTYVVNDNGTITASGTASGTSYAITNIATNRELTSYLPAGTYRLTGGIDASKQLYLGGLYDDGTAFTTVYDSGSGATYTFTKGAWVYPQIFITNGTTIDATFNIQLELGSTATAYEPYTGTTTPVNLGRTVYGGTLDVVSGVLTAYPFYPSYNGETLNGRWVCDRAVYAEGTTPPTGSQVALISGTGTIYTLTPTEVSTLLGENNVCADSGDVGVVYVRDLNIAINNLLNSNGTRSLGMMAMSAPTEATAEEPTDEQTEEPAEDDMR